ncbi:MAG: endonuclease MutS2 [Lachnospiraceae bacterium]|nr:endonuclease MutS2 [Lachnospiraceae bacterium]
MNHKVLKTLEFDKIIARLEEKCLTPLGKKEARLLTPLETVYDVRDAQQETEDALSRIYRYGSFSASGARDIRESLARLRVQASLSMPELLSVAMLLRTAERVKAYGNAANNNGNRKKAVSEPPEEEGFRDSLTDYFNALDPASSFYREIDRCILSEEEMADDASSGLLSVRRRMKNAQSKVRDELNRLVVSQGSWLQDHVITMRNGRYCLPVKNEFRGQVPGMIHDESSSGSTVFIEPLAVVKLNNEIRELEIAERKEIEAVLANLSAEAAGREDALRTDLNILSHLDFVFGKAALAKEMNAVRPAFTDNHVLELRQARHPLLDPKTAVPIDVRLGETFDTLIVTGPNTGGKTVSLKTVGLLTLMGQAGLHIPASEGSKLGHFEEVYADIGDEQSIEQSLSTFSSHMKNLTSILRKADEDSLVLLDELCAGTDPEEGANLAIAILKALRARGARSMATTHYSELKLFALTTEGVENASCEFDIGTLSPTYKLLIGIPGKSNAFAISRRLGLDPAIIEEAQRSMDQDSVAFEDVIRDLNDSKRKMDREKSKIGQLKAEANRLRESLSAEEAKTEEKRQKILADARREAQDMLQKAKAQLDETIRAMNRQGKDVRELEQHRTKTREMIQDTLPKDAVKEPVKKASAESKELKPGDKVLVLPLGVQGIVSTAPDTRGELYVQVGILRSQFKISDLEKLEDQGTPDSTKKAPRASASSGEFGKAATISPEINLIGMNQDDASAALEKYLDDAYLSHLKTVRIVHGRGTGALRNAVQRLLKQSVYIKSYRLGTIGEGDSGVTIAEFK